MPKTVALIGTLDTKGREFAFLREHLRRNGVETLVIDASVVGEPAFPPDIDRSAFYAAGGFDHAALKTKNDRGAAVAAAATAAEALAKKLYAEGRIHAIIALGGAAGTTIGAAAMRALPVGVPKVMVSTMASGDTRPYVGTRDICMMHSVVDIAGLNRLSCTILANAANAITGMVNGPQPPALSEPRRSAQREGARVEGLIGMTMFGVTTPCVLAAQKILEENGYECLVFHATGAGGRAMESLIEDGFIAGVCDVTTTEWADELVGGVLSAGPTRLEAAAKKGIPQVVSVGALDMVNFGPRDTVPAKFKDRTFYQHNPNVTLMRTTIEENRKLGEIIASKLNPSRGPVRLYLPLKGLSAIDREGQPFDDPAARRALYESLGKHLDAKKVRIVRMNCHINEPEFAAALAQAMMELMRKARV